LVHRGAGLAYGLSGIGLLAMAWFDVGIGLLVAGFAAALFVPATLAGLATLVLRGS